MADRDGLAINENTNKNPNQNPIQNLNQNPNQVQGNVQDISHIIYIARNYTHYQSSHQKHKEFK